MGRKMNPKIAFLKSLFPASYHSRIVMVGGTVRDMITDRECKDLDLVSSLTDGELLALGFRLVEASSSADIYFRHNPDFGKIEITRINNMDGLDDDLCRRDFTINAIAMNFEGTRIDPLKGNNDLASKILRACSSKTFSNDPLRIFRAFRFECDGWRMSLETEKLIGQQDWSSCFSSMPIERFSNEMLKALAAETPERFFERMIEFSVGADFLPELFQMPAIPAGPLEHHPEGDLFTHSVQVLQRVAAISENPLARFCAFFHDLGKLATDPALYPKHHGHDDAGFEMAEPFCNRLCLPTAYRKALAWVSRLHGKVNKWEELRDSTKLKMTEQAIKAGIVELLPLVAFADKPGNSPITEWDNAVLIAASSANELGVDIQKLETMPIDKRPAFIMQKRIKVFSEVNRNKAKRILDQIVSGGQTGADRAALDVAVSLGITSGGYCPFDRKAEDGRIPDSYPLKETRSPKYEKRTKLNVRSSDGTLVLNLGQLDGGTRMTMEYAEKIKMPCMLVFNCINW
jgi:tRNA nucleotidyltransferase (CCA-adding enzyme)